MKLNQFNVVVEIVTPAALKQLNNGMAVLEVVGRTLDGKQTVQFSAFKETAESLAPQLVLGSEWAFFGSLSGRSYTDKTGTSRVANGCIINAAIKVKDAEHMQAPDAAFGDEDIPF